MDFADFTEIQRFEKILVFFLKFLNQAHAHSRPKAGCGRAPGLL